MTAALLHALAFWFVVSAALGPKAYGAHLDAGLLEPWQVARPMLILLALGCALHVAARLA